MNKYIKILTITSFIFLFSSCEDYFGDVNVDPNNPGAVPPNTLLAPAQSVLSYAYWGDLSRYVGIFTKQVDGVDRQWSAYQDYIIRGNDLDAFWQTNIYSNVLTDLDKMREVVGPASENGLYHGIANILEAYTILMLTDYFGDIPYTEALNRKKDGNIQPKFDSHESVINAARALLESGKTLLSGPSALTPGAADFIYGGDKAKWEKFANAILARTYLNTSGRNSGDLDKALTAATNSFTSNADNAGVPFEDSKPGPWYQFNEQRTAVNLGSFYKGLLESTNDPRIDKLGAELRVEHPVLTKTVAMPFITYTEMLFIMAEVQLKKGNKAEAYTHYTNAIESTFDRFGVEGFTEFQSNASVFPGADNLSLENIITQKYIGLFLDPTVFSDWRRTGFPALTPNSGSQIPRRLPYPQTETDYNVNCPRPSEVTIFSRVWWDAN